MTDRTDDQPSMEEILCRIRQQHEEDRLREQEAGPEPLKKSGLI